MHWIAPQTYCRVIILLRTLHRGLLHSNSFMFYLHHSWLMWKKVYEMLQIIENWSTVILMYCYNSTNVINFFFRLNTTQEPICLSAVFSLTTYYFNGAKRCNCDLTGSYDNDCDSFTGQCHCKPGVGGQRCDACLPEYFNFRSTGCTGMLECIGYSIWNSYNVSQKKLAPKYTDKYGTI